MKKLFKTLLVCSFVFTLVACGGKKDDKTLVVSATPAPHAEILEFAKDILKDDYGITLEIKVIDDYVTHNQALNTGEIDANYFQHVPYFNKQVAEFGYDIANVAGIHIEPFGIYSKTITSVDAIPTNGKVIISNSVADHGRILAILESAGLLTLKDGVDVLDATVADIASNPKNLTFVEINPELLYSAYNNKEGDIVAINGNFAIANGLNPTKDAVILEEGGEENPYVNIIAVKKGHENDENIKSLIEVLKSEAVKNFILEQYSNGSVIPAK